MKIEEMSKDEKSLLLYLECRATDDRGKVDGRHMNATDFEIAEKWAEQGFVDFGRLHSSELTPKKSHYVIMTDKAWELAHALRKERGLRNQYEK